MKVTYQRDSKLAITGITIECPIMTEHGWATVVTEENVDRYDTRGVMQSAVRQRTDVIENCPNVTNEKGDVYPDYAGHRMWDNSRGLLELN